MGPLLTFNLDGTERRAYGDLWRVWLLAEAEAGVPVQIQVDPQAALRWEELDRLPELIELHYQGADPRVQEYLAARPQISRFDWTGHRQSRIDLSATQLVELGVECGPGPLELHLPAGGTLRRLALAPPDAPGALRIEAPDGGSGIYLMQGCQHLPEGPRALPGLERLRALSLFPVRRVRLERLLPYRELEELTLSGPPGAVEGLARLAEFPKLRRVSLRDCYELDVHALPPASAFPTLEAVEVDGIRQADAAVLSQRLAGLKTLSLRGKRTDAWLRAHLDNPFREWPEEHGASRGKAAMSAYRQAALALDRAGTAGEPEAIRAGLEAFVRAFNRLSAREPFDTIQREQVMDAYDELASRVNGLVPVETTRQWFEEWEDL